MPVYAAEDQAPELPGSPSRLSILRQVLEWVYQPEKKVDASEQDAGNKRILLLEEAEAEKSFNMATVTVVNGAVASAAATSAKCPYSAVAKNPAVPYVFQMPLHYPRYTKADYESMPEWQLDRLLEEYGLPISSMGSLRDKREYAIGAFIWRE